MPEYDPTMDKPGTRTPTWLTPEQKRIKELEAEVESYRELFRELRRYGYSGRWYDKAKAVLNQEDAEDGK